MPDFGELNSQIHKRLGLDGEVQNYAGDGNAMLKLIEAMRERGWNFILMAWLDGCRASFWKGSQAENPAFDAAGEMPANVTALAALAALEGQNA